MLRAVHVNRFGDVSTPPKASERILALHAILAMYFQIRPTLTQFGEFSQFPPFCPSPLVVGHLCPLEVGFLPVMDYVTQCFSSSAGHISPVAMVLLQRRKPLFPLIWHYMDRPSHRTDPLAMLSNNYGQIVSELEEEEHEGLPSSLASSSTRPA